jgi:hypothetical protein
MALDREFQKKLQVFMAAAILVAGGRAAYIVYERHEGMKELPSPRRKRRSRRIITSRRRNCMPTI